MTPPITREPILNEPNKAIVAALATVVTTGVRWAVSDDLNLNDEGLIALGGAITTVLVYAVSNFRKLFRS